jgi:YVTN family beta-propeller protein
VTLRAAIAALAVLASTAAHATTLASFPGPWEITPIGGNLWVTQYNFAGITVIDDSGNTIATIATGPNPTVPALSPDGSLAFVPNEYANTIQIVDTSSYQIVGSIPIPGKGATALAKIDPNQTFGYFTKDPSTLEIFNPSTGQITGSIDSGVKLPRGLSFNASGSLAIVTGEDSNTVSIISTKTQTVKFVVPVGLKPRSSAVLGPYAYVADQNSNSVSKVDMRTGTVVATIPVGSQPRRIIASGRAILVSNQASNTVSIIRGDQVVKTIATGATPIGLYVDPDRQLYVAASGANEVQRFNLGVLSLSDRGSSVPEPSTWAMMLLGFAGLGFAGWRHAKKTSPVSA